MIDIVIGGKAGKSERRHVPDCLSCENFRVSWDASFPRSCTVFGFKTKNLPSVDVLNDTGMNCPSYRRRNGAI